jgi:hypothetical protein
MVPNGIKDGGPPGIPADMRCEDWWTSDRLCFTGHSVFWAIFQCTPPTEAMQLGCVDH